MAPIYTATVVIELVGYDPILKDATELTDHIIDCLEKCEHPMNCSKHLEATKQRMFEEVV